jgi:hypothetical protein
LSAVFVYRNTVKQCWSVRDCATGRLLTADDPRGPGHRDELALAICAFHVGARGRARMLETGKRTIHAGVFGLVLPSHEAPKSGWVTVTYRPHEGPTFYEVATATPIHLARFVEFTPDGKCRAIPC